MSMSYNQCVGILGAICLLAAPAAVLAEGWSVGASIGDADVDDFDDSDTGIKLFGGYDFNENFRVEGFWVDFGEVEISSGGLFAEAEADGLGVAAMGILPTSEQVDVFGKVGLLSWDSDLRTNVFGPTETFSDDGTDPFFGFGARFHLADQFGIRAEWEEFELDDVDVRLLSVGVDYSF